jgi:hypothetical protein
MKPLTIYITYIAQYMDECIVITSPRVDYGFIVHTCCPPLRNKKGGICLKSGRLITTVPP